MGKLGFKEPFGHSSKASMPSSYSSATCKQGITTTFGYKLELLVRMPSQAAIKVLQLVAEIERSSRVRTTVEIRSAFESKDFVDRNLQRCNPQKQPKVPSEWVGFPLGSPLHD